MRLQFLATVMVGMCIVSTRVYTDQKFITVSPTIIAGTVEKQPGFVGGTATLCGTDGISIVTGLGIFAPNFPGGEFDPLYPGTTRIFGGGSWVGSDLISPVVTLRGKTYDGSSAPDFRGGINLSFRSETITIPPLIDSLTTVTAPFTLVGSFAMENDDVKIDASLSGGGTGTLVLMPHPVVEGAWTSLGWQLEFSPAHSLNAKAPQCGSVPE
jgi:hypothetical protein